MTTIGQRIKNFRKSVGLSQAELAGRIGVAAQTVSKWECDVGLPDIVQIVPLADVLDVSTDAILGADSSMEKNIESVLSAVREKWADGVNDQSPDRTSLHYDFDFFNAYKEILRRYPMNFDAAMRGAHIGNRLLRHLGSGFPYIESFSVKGVARDVERMCHAIINYDDSINNKAEAKRLLAETFYFSGDEERAKDELAGLPFPYYNIAKYHTAIFDSDYNVRIKAAKDGFSEACGKFLYWLRAIADAYSAAGIYKRAETYEACHDLVKFCSSFSEFCGKYELYYYEMIGNLLLAQNYVRDGRYDDALDAIERMTDVIERSFEHAKTENNGSANGSIYFDFDNDEKVLDLDELKENFYWDLMYTKNDFSDPENNPVANSERFKSCLERIKSLS